jgi:hypothetical protein
MARDVGLFQLRPADCCKYSVADAVVVAGPFTRESATFQVCGIEHDQAFIWSLFECCGQALEGQSHPCVGLIARR